MNCLRTKITLVILAMILLAVAAFGLSGRARPGQGQGRRAQVEESEAGDADGNAGHARDGKRLFERETFGGNGRTCATCHGIPGGAGRRFDTDVASMGAHSKHKEAS